MLASKGTLAARKPYTPILAASSIQRPTQRECLLQSLCNAVQLPPSNMCQPVSCWLGFMFCRACSQANSGQAAYQMRVSEGGPCHARPALPCCCKSLARLLLTADQPPATPCRLVKQLLGIGLRVPGPLSQTSCPTVTDTVLGVTTHLCSPSGWQS